MEKNLLSRLLRLHYTSTKPAAIALDELRLYNNNWPYILVE